MAEHDTLLQIADELYALALPDFTSARDARATELKGSELAAAVKALRKPSLAAWVVNLLVRHETEQVEQVLSLGESLRSAQQSMSGEELRALTRQRRQLTAAVTTVARRLAREHGQRVTDVVAEHVEATLTAAMVEADCARAVRSGLLISALTATGLGATDLSAAVALPAALGFEATHLEAEPPARPELRVVPDPDAAAKARQAAREVWEGAEQDLAAASEAALDGAAELTDLQARSMQIQAEIDELRRRIADLEETGDEVDEQLTEAEEVRDGAQLFLDEMRARRDAAAAAVRRLKG